MVWVRERLGAERVSERRACQVLGQARSTQRREKHIPDEEALATAATDGSRPCFVGKGGK